MTAKKSARTRATDKTAEQGSGDTESMAASTEAETIDQNDMADDWAAAMAEQIDSEAGEEVPSQDVSTNAARAESSFAGDQVFKELKLSDRQDKSNRDLEMVMDIPVKLNVELGRTRITIKELLELTEGSVVELDGLAGDPMDILINGYPVAQGEVVVVDDKYGIRITEIITASERIHKINR